MRASCARRRRRPSRSPGGPLHRLQPLPERRVRPGVAGEDPPAGGAAVDAVADRRHRVRGRQHLDLLAAEQHRLADGDRRQCQGRMLGARQPGEVGPDHAIEDVGAQRRQRLGQRVDLDRRTTFDLALADHAVGQQPDRKHMVEMRMGDQDVLDPGQRLERQVADAGAGVHQDVVVQQERSRPAAGRDGTGAAEHLNDHGGPMFGPDGLAAQAADDRNRRRPAGRHARPAQAVKCVTRNGRLVSLPREGAAELRRPGRTASASRRARSRRRSSG